MVIRILSIERYKYGIDGVKACPPEIAALVGKSLYKGKEVIERNIHIRQEVGVFAVQVRVPL